jgi:hypothetical protein
MLQRYRMPSLYGITSNYFWEGAATKIPKKIKSVGFVSGARLCHEHKMRATTNNFSLRKKNGPRKPGMFFEPGPNPNITCGPEARRQGPGRHLRQITLDALVQAIGHFLRPFSMNGAMSCGCDGPQWGRPSVQAVALQYGGSQSKNGNFRAGSYNASLVKFTSFPWMELHNVHNSIFHPVSMRCSYR